MKNLIVYGASDDLIETEGIPGCDEFNVHNSPYVCKLIISWDGKDQIGIHCIYDGAWCFAVGTEDAESDFRKFPNVNVARSFGTKSEYSETLLITLPDDAKLRLVKSE